MAQIASKKRRNGSETSIPDIVDVPVGTTVGSIVITDPMKGLIDVMLAASKDHHFTSYDDFSLVTKSSCEEAIDGMDSYWMDRGIKKKEIDTIKSMILGYATALKGLFPYVLEHTVHIINPNVPITFETYSNFVIDLLCGFIPSTALQSATSTVKLKFSQSYKFLHGESLKESEKMVAELQKNIRIHRKVENELFAISRSVRIELRKLTEDQIYLEVIKDPTYQKLTSKLTSKEMRENMLRETKTKDRLKWANERLDASLKSTSHARVECVRNQLAAFLNHIQGDQNDSTFLREFKKGPDPEEYIEIRHQESEFVARSAVNDEEDQYMQDINCYDTQCSEY